jgi:hypothetical protein
MLDGLGSLLAAARKEIPPRRPEIKGEARASDPEAMVQRPVPDAGRFPQVPCDLDILLLTINMA